MNNPLIAEKLSKDYSEDIFNQQKKIFNRKTISYPIRAKSNSSRKRKNRTRRTRTKRKKTKINLVTISRLYKRFTRKGKQNPKRI